ncbi:Glyceraldehyde-3-phosphate dehydrogenase 2 [Cucumispora dikerogammari]|nr:Glyceraldehyde-3-phosphate dehydrogenase 2 [Cucumispora dikerogammari]
MSGFKEEKQNTEKLKNSVLQPGLTANKRSVVSTSPNCFVPYKPNSRTVGINGFGRIGKLIYSMCIKQGIPVVHINDPNTTVDDIVYSLTYDNCYGKTLDVSKCKMDERYINGSYRTCDCELNIVNKKCEACLKQVDKCGLKKCNCEKVHQTLSKDNNDGSCSESNSCDKQTISNTKSEHMDQGACQCDGPCNKLNCHNNKTECPCNDSCDEKECPIKHGKCLDKTCSNKSYQDKKEECPCGKTCVDEYCTENHGECLCQNSCDESSCVVNHNSCPYKYADDTEEEKKNEHKSSDQEEHDEKQYSGKCPFLQHCCLVKNHGECQEKKCPLKCPFLQYCCLVKNQKESSQKKCPEKCPFLQYCCLIKKNATSVKNYTETNTFFRTLLTNETDPINIQWECDLLIEATGLFKTKDLIDGHRVKKVIVTAPTTDIPMFVYGVNHIDYLKEMPNYLSNASCTTNCLAPIVKLLDDEFEIIKGTMSTIHSVTASQSVVDRSSRYRRNRTILNNIIPTTTGATAAVVKVFPHLENRLSGMAFRVPTLDVSCIDLTVFLKNECDKDKLINLIKRGDRNILDYTDDEVVSSDFIGDSRSCILDVGASMMSGRWLKLVCWYDNEYGYAQRVADLTRFVLENYEKKTENDIKNSTE